MWAIAFKTFNTKEEYLYSLKCYIEISAYRIVSRPRHKLRCLGDAEYSRVYRTNLAPPENINTLDF